MDLTDVQSPSSKTHHLSFSLLDEKAIEDLSLENLRVRDKPPIPNKQLIQQRMSNLVKQSTNEDDFNFNHNNVENPEQTVESIRLDESDLKKLEDEFTFEEDEESDESDQTNTNINANKLSDNYDYQNQFRNDLNMSKNFGYSFKNELTSVSPDQFLDKSVNLSTHNDFKIASRRETQSSNDFLMDESSNILRNSGEFDNTNVNNSNNSLPVINYDKMDEINKSENTFSNDNSATPTNEDKTINKSINFTKESNFDFDQTPKAKSDMKVYERKNDFTSNDFNEKSMSRFNLTGIEDSKIEKNELTTTNFINQSDVNQSQNEDFNQTINNSFATSENLRQLVMQSVEKMKRIGQANLPDSTCEDYFSEINKNLLKAPLLTKDQDRFSTSTFRSARLNDFSISNQKDMSVLNNLENSNLTTPSKTFSNQSLLNDKELSNKENQSTKLPSFYFKPDQLDQSKVDFNTNPFDLPSNQMKLLDNPFESIHTNSNVKENFSFEANPFDCKSKIEFNYDDDAQFKGAVDFMEELKKDEILNRKEFADNNLTVCMNFNDKTNVSLNQTTNNSSNDSSGSSKWWNQALNAHQASKLELSNVSTLNDSKMNLNQQSDTSKSSLNKQKIPVTDYFNRKSEMPAYLADKESDVRLSEYLTKKIELNEAASNLNDKTLLADGEKNDAQKISDEDITFSSNNQGSTLSSSNFSFTLNASDTGEFIQKKNKSKTPTSTTPFQLSKALASHNSKLKQIDQKTTDSKPETDLKLINKELDQVSNRLALNSEVKNINSIKQAISEPLMSSSIKLSNTNPNLKSLIQMDETISSINSSDITTNSLKSKTTSKISSVESNNNSNANSKSNKDSKTSKMTSGSLTSTPSKLTKSISEMSNLNQISTSNIMEKFYKSNDQESFISSIPERTNDSTLVGNHHQQHHHHNHHSQKIKSSSSKSKKSKNAEIQTSPSQSDSTTGTIILKSANHQDQETNNRVSISSVYSSTNSSTSSDTTTNPSIASQFNVINNLAAAMINNSSGNCSTAANGLVPVAFLPLNSFLPCVQKIYDDMQTSNMQTSNKSSSNKSNFENSHSISTHSLNHALNSKLFVDTANFSGNTTSSLPSQCSQYMMNNTKFELPQIEFDINSIDFGHMAEGCSKTLRIFSKLTNSNSFLKQLNSNYIQIEVCDSLDWNIETYDYYDEYDESNKKLNDEIKANKSKKNFIKKKFTEYNLKSKFRKCLTLHPDKSSLNETDLNSTQTNAKSSWSTKLQFDLISNMYEFFIHLNLKDLNFYSHLVQNLDQNGLDQLEPLLIQTSIFVYYFLNTDSSSSSSTNLSISNQKKILLNRLDLKFVLGYARVRTNSPSDYIEFEIPEDINNMNKINTKQINEKQTDDFDRTLISSNEINQKKKPFELEQLIPLFNAGNIDIEVDFYISLGQQDLLQSIYFKSYEIKLDDSVLLLQARSKHKQYAKILLNKVTSQINNQNLDLDKLKFIIQVKPNGLIYEIPIKIKFTQQNSIKPQNSILNEITNNKPKTSSNLKMSSSRPILFFGKSLISSIKSNQDVNSGLSDEFTIVNSNLVKIKIQINLITLNENVVNSFKFSNELKNSSANLNESMTQLNISLEPSESFRLKIKFYPPHNQFDSNTIITGVAKMTIAGCIHKFNVNLIGFLSESLLEIENDIKISDLCQSNNLDQQLTHRNIKNSKYSIELIQTQTAGLSSSKNIYRKVLKLKNKSINSKCLIYPCLFNNKLNKEIFLSSNRLTKTNELCYDLGMDSNGFINRLRILLNKDNLLNSTADLNWIEIRPDEQYSLNLELISIKSDKNEKTKSDLTNIEDVFLCLFWIEFDINSYCTHFVQSTNISNQKPISMFLDSFLNKLLSNNNFFTNQNGLSMSSLNINESSSKLNRLSSVSAVSFADQSYSSISNSSMMLLNHSKTTRDDYMRLLRQSVKCTVLNISAQSFEFDNDSFDISESSKREHAIDTKPIVNNNNNNNNNKKQQSDLLQITLSKNQSNDSDDKNKINSSETWSLNPTTILIENIKSEKLIENYSEKIYLKNNLNRKELNFDIKYRSNYLSVSPSNGIIEPLKTIEITIKPRKEVFSILPWFGLISIWCNKIQKDVRVNLYPNLVASTSSSNLTLEVPRTLQMSQSINKTSSSINTLAPSLTSSSTPYNSTNKCSNNNSSSLEQGSIISEISQYTIDSMSLTPLISASFIMPPSTSFSSSINQSNNQKTNSTAKLNSFKNDSKFNSTLGNPDESITKIMRSGNDAQVRFPPVCVTQRKSVELTLTNPTTGYVNWKAYSTVPAFVKLKDDENNIMKSSYSVFMITPNSGTIPANQNQKIKIEFCPREVYGLFNQYWEIDTRTDFQDISSNSSESSMPTSYTCRLVLTGQSIPLDNQKTIEKLAQEDYSSRLANRILKSKTNTYNDESANIESNKQFKSNDMLINGIKSKENMSFMNTQKSSSSLIGASLLSNGSNSSFGSEKNKCAIRDELIKFPDTQANQVSKSYITVHNREMTELQLNILTLMEPFYCKHTDLVITPKHYIKIPIEFRPKTIGDYTDKVLIRIDKYETPLSCVIKAKCISNN